MTDTPVPTPKRGGLLDRFFPDRTLGILGGLTFLVVLVAYLKTMSPTVSFWDCGEFITCSHILGIPHPPGTPLYVLLGRIFALLPTSSDPSVQINLLSTIPSAVGALIAYFILARMITWWYSDQYPNPNLPLAKRLSIYAGAICGSLFYAFSNTNWSNAVEAEVYGLSMFLMLLIFWVALIWVQRRDEPDSDRFLVLLSYLGFLALGVHLTVFLIMPPIFLIVIWLSPRLRKDPRFYITGVAMLLVAVHVVDFLFVTAAWFVITVLMTLAGTTKRRWSLFAALSFVALLGWSTHVYIPLRSDHDPAIDQNNPETWDSFFNFLERRQYGSESMLTRAMTRRGEWSNQFGQHARMGFWGFFDQQYGFNDIVFFPLFAVGLIGIGVMIVRKRAVGVALLFLLLASSVGLVWYMNFADGTKYDPVAQDKYLEVRDRDYFFTPAFILFGMSIGLGGAALVRWLSSGATGWAVGGAAIVALLPSRALYENYQKNNRSNNYVAYDYAYNILSSADSSAVLFTNGDNDTFPVWCLQYVYHVRPDVRIVNLSLLNTHWYIKQLKDEMHVPMRLTDNQIDRLVHYREKNGSVRRIQDQMVEEILTANDWKEPIDFSVTVSASSRRYHGQSLDDHLLMIGVVQRLVKEEGHDMVDLPLMQHRLDSVFQFRSLSDPTVHMDENTTRLVGNYFSTFLIVAEELRLKGDYEGAERYAMKGIKTVPYEPDGLLYLAQMYTMWERPDKLDSLLAMVKDSPYRDRVETDVSAGFRKLGDTTRSIALLQDVMRRAPDYEVAYRSLVQLYYQTHQYDTLMTLMEGWMERNPADGNSQKILAQVRELIQRLKGNGAPAVDTTSASSPPS